MINLPADFVSSLELSDTEKSELIEALNNQKSDAVMLNRFKKNEGLDKFEKVVWCDHGRYLNEGTDLLKDPLFHAGTYIRQDPSSMFIETIIDSIDLLGDAVLCLNSAPGGISAHLASIIPSSALLVSNEVNRSKAWGLKENLDKWGASNIIVTNNNPEDFKLFEGAFNAIVVNAVSSNEGLFGVSERARKDWSLHHVNTCASKQIELLEQVIPCLQDGGTLIYSTNAFNKKENIDVLDWLETNYNVENVEFPVPSSIELVEKKAYRLKGYQFYPSKIKGEGCFISAIKVSGGRNQLKVPKRIKKVRVDAFKGEEYINNERNELYKIKDELVSFPTKHVDLLKCIIWDLNPVKIGTKVADEMKGKFKFSHELPFSKDLNKDVFPVIEVELEDAIKYLQKKEISILPDIKDWAIVSYHSHNLGFVKRVGNRLNNYYPKEFRIRKEFN